jgi:two-component system sensor histidine kinase/response regulator
MGKDANAPVALLCSGTLPASGSAFMRRVSVEIPKPVKSSMLYDFLLSRSSVATPRAERDPATRFDASVLLVEDNPVNVEVASAMLRQTGCQVTVATNGRRALEILEESSFDLVLMDCQMPGLDGYASTRMIREREASTGAHQRIVAVTAHTLAGDREACLAAGMDDYMAKPFSPLQMRAMLLANLARDARIATGAHAVLVQDAAAVEPVHCAEKFAELVRMESEGNPGLVARLGRHFEEQSRAANAALDAALGGGKLAEAADAMHSFRSTAGHLGGKRVALVCMEIERACSENDLPRVEQAAPRFSAEVSSLRRALAIAMPVPVAP